MSHTRATLKTFFKLSGTKPIIGDPQLDRLLVWLNGKRGVDDSTPDDLADYLYDDLIAKVLAKELGMAQDRVATPKF